MFAKATLLLAAMQASLAVAGNAILNNHCSYDIWIWTVDPSGSTAAKVPAGSQHSEPLRNAAVAIKVSKTSQLVAGAQTQFEYSIVNNQVWFDLSFVNCANGQSSSSCPGADKGLSMNSPNSACGSLSCAPGSYCPTQAYFVDTPVQKLGIAEPVFTCPGAGTNLDVVMTMCSGGGSSKRSIAGRLLIDA